MDQTSRNIAVCHHCPQVDWCSVGNPCKSDAQRRQFSRLAELHECPLDKFGSRGIGDVVASVLRVTGVKAVVEGIARRRGKPCGCKKRQEKLNELVPFKEK